MTCIYPSTIINIAWVCFRIDICNDLQASLIFARSLAVRSAPLSETSLNSRFQTFSPCGINNRTAIQQAFVHANFTTFEQRNFRIPNPNSSSTLVKIGLSDCKVRSLPVYLNAFEKVKYLDARNNYIATVPSEVTKWSQDRNSVKQ